MRKFKYAEWSISLSLSHTYAYSLSPSSPLFFSSSLCLSFTIWRDNLINMLIYNNFANTIVLIWHFGNLSHLIPQHPIHPAPLATLNTSHTHLRQLSILFSHVVHGRPLGLVHLQEVFPGSQVDIGLCRGCSWLLPHRQSLKSGVSETWWKYNHEYLITK